MMNDLRYAVRQLLRSPGFSAIAIVTIALGIGACTAIFSVVSGVLLRPLPYPESDRLVVVRETNFPTFPEFSVSPGNYFSWLEQSTSWQSLAAVRNVSYNLTGRGEPQRLQGLRVTANYLRTLGVAPALGRDFSPEDDVPGHERVAILSHGFWQRLLGGRPDVLGQTLQLDGQPFTVVGVMPASFQPQSRRVDRGVRAELYTPAAYTPDDHSQHGGHYIGVFGRLKAGVGVDQARSEMSLIADRLAKQFPGTNKGWGVKLTPMLDADVGEVRPVLMALLGAVGFLLLIACANVANLLLVRATARRKEIAVRGALGAGRGRIVRQLLTESVLLALLGGLLGLLVAQGGVSALLALAPDALPRAREVTIDLGALGFSVGLALVTGIVFGLMPAIQVTRLDLQQTLKQGGRGATDGSSRHRLRGALVVTELATALVLLVGAGLLMRSFVHLQGVDVGFRPDNAVAVALQLPGKKYATDPQQATFIDRATRSLAAIPGVQAVGAGHVVPLGGDYVLGFEIKGRPPIAPSDLPITNYYAVGADYFRAMGIGLVRGRTFTAIDTAASEPVGIISESMARRHFRGEDPIGKFIKVTYDSAKWLRIVGIVRDVRQYDLHSDVTVQTYEPVLQRPFESLTFIVRTGGPVGGLPGAIRRAIYDVDRDQPIATIRPLQELVDRSIARQRFAMLLFAVFSATALLLAAIGIYGVMAYSVRQRTGEIGVRIALGARSGDVLGLVFRQGGRLLALGLAAGVAGALLLTRFLSTLLFGVSAHDPLTFVAIALLLSLTAALACLLPARRASTIDPMTALRSE
jgi:putative ABC transport system permease protein